MIKKYRDQLRQIKIKMEEAEKFAKKLPVFSDQILENKYTGNEDWISFGEKYKDIPLGWGIKRGLYKSDTTRRISNFGNKSYTKFLFNIYINTYSLFGHYERLGFDEVARKANVFFYDALNSTFYATDEQITELLELLNDWYVRAKKENEKYLYQQKIEKARADLEFAQKRLKNLNQEVKNETN